MSTMHEQKVTGLLGLALRANKLAVGSDLVADMATSGKMRVLLISADAGAAIKRDAAFFARKANVPMLTLPCDKLALGKALGRSACAICALSDIGFAASVAKQLADISPENTEASEILSAKNIRIQSRKGKKSAKAEIKQGNENSVQIKR